MSDIVGDDRRPADFTSCSGSSWDRYEWRNVIGNKHIAADKIIILEQILPVMDSQSDRPGNIQGCATADSHNAVTLTAIEGIGPFVDIRLDGVLVDVMKNFN